MVNWFHLRSPYLFGFAILMLAIVLSQWWADVSAEGATQGLHALLVEAGLRFGIILFIVSEVFLFVSFFWAFFHRSLAPTLELGAT
jgi:cytochrome c oxidase subunit 3